MTTSFCREGNYQFRIDNVEFPNAMNVITHFTIGEDVTLTQQDNLCTN
ncbi:MAG: hypothetical protein QNJ53_25485 [Pleurocapsa sp. MO_192.B19]|nr:hypothetical protein [Pleurocapsa sp. MO_192.B19]